MIVENLIENNYGDSNLSRNEKILHFLKKYSGSEVNTNFLSQGTGIAKSNLSKILGPLEKKGKITRRYEQVGRARSVFISLTNSQDKITNSHEIMTNSQEHTTNSHEIMTNSQLENNANFEGIHRESDKIAIKNKSKNMTNSQEHTTNSQTNLATISQKRQAEYINKMGEELQKFGKITSIDKMQEMAIFLRENSKILKRGLKTVLSTYRKYKENINRDGLRTENAETYYNALECINFLNNNIIQQR